MTKKLLTLAGASLALLLAVTGCNNNEPTRLDQDVKLVINVQDAKMKAADTDLPANPARLTPKELVEQAHVIALIDGIGEESYTEFFLQPQWKDVEHTKINLPKYYILDIHHSTDTEPYLVDYLIKATDIRILKEGGFGLGEIIGYIPQSVVKEAYPKIKEAFERKDYDTAYKLFEEAYVAYPCTAEEWAKLKEEGRN